MPLEQTMIMGLSHDNIPRSIGCGNTTVVIITAMFADACRKAPHNQATGAQAVDWRADAPMQPGSIQHVGAQRTGTAHGTAYIVVIMTSIVNHNQYYVVCYHH